MSRTRSVARWALRPVVDWLDRRVDARVDSRVDERLAARPSEAPAPADSGPPAPRVWVPPIDSLRAPADAPFMEYASCSAADFVHPEFERIAASLGTSPPHFHRKLWEYVFVVHHLERLGVLRPGARGLGFGVGTEPLTAAFAARGCDIVATDAPGDVAERSGWGATRQYGSGLDQLDPFGLCEPDELRARVEHRFVDMNAIDPDLTGFDFCWSACCFEHLGSLRHGLDFVHASVEQCLRPGGFAVHTTELNLSSNTETFESPRLSVYRRRDLDELADELRGWGHTVSAITVAPDASYLDRYVDVPPYDGDLHLKLELAGHVATSVGVVVQKRAG